MKVDANDDAAGRSVKRRRLCAKAGSSYLYVSEVDDSLSVLGTKSSYVARSQNLAYNAVNHTAGGKRILR